MLAITALVVALQLVAVYGPLQGFLDLEPLGAIDLALCVGAGVGLLAVLEGTKAWRRARLPAA